MRKTKKKRKGNEKKAELTSGQLVSIVILVISFVIILLLWRIYYWNPIIDKQACHQSIVFRSSVNFGVIKSSKIVPLKCQTEKDCFSMSGNDCIQVGKNTEDNTVVKLKLDKDPEKAKQQILSQITESMRDCHSMLGEGKLAFMPEGFFGSSSDWSKQNYCLICNRIVLDDEARQKVEDITYPELYRALANKKTSNKKTYLEYLHPEWKDWRSAARLFQDFKKNPKNSESVRNNMKFEDWKMGLADENGFAIIAQIAPYSYWQSVTGSVLVAGGIVLGAALTATYVGAPLGITLIVSSVSGAAAGGATFWYSSPTGEFSYSPPSVHPYNLAELQGMNCYSFESAP